MYYVRDSWDFEVPPPFWGPEQFSAYDFLCFEYQNDEDKKRMAVKLNASQDARDACTFLVEEILAGRMTKERVTKYRFMENVALLVRFKYRNTKTLMYNFYQVWEKRPRNRG